MLKIPYQLERAFNLYPQTSKQAIIVEILYVHLNLQASHRSLGYMARLPAELSDWLDIPEHRNVLLKIASGDHRYTVYPIYAYKIKEDFVKSDNSLNSDIDEALLFTELGSFDSLKRLEQLQELYPYATPQIVDLSDNEQFLWKKQSNQTY